MGSKAQRRMAVVAEDEHVRLFLLGLLERAQAQLASGMSWSIVATELTHGCRQATLRDLVHRLGDSCDLVLVGTDVYQADHARKCLTSRQKVQRLKSMIGDVPCALCVVAAQPCVEAWLLATGPALVRALETRLACAFKAPPAWPVPTSEPQAKDDLARVLLDGTGTELARRGFEYARDVLRACDLDAVPNSSLRAAFREIRSALHG